MKFQVKKDCPSEPTFVRCHCANDVAFGIIMLGHYVTHCYVSYYHDGWRLEVVPVKCKDGRYSCKVWKNNIRLTVAITMKSGDEPIAVEVLNLELTEWRSVISD